MNFIPKESRPCYDYMCTWALQEATASKIGLHSGDGCTDQRDALTDELLFGSARYYHPYDRTYRSGLSLLLDDGWDVPFGSKNSWQVERFFGTCDPNPEKFPNYGKTPVERLRTLNQKAKDFGYAGIGLWIATETGGSGKGDLGVGEEARKYWAERARWCEQAGVLYWKIDWGRHCDPTYRRMLTEVLRENAPSISGYTARMLSKWHPSTKLVGMSPSISAVRKMMLYWGVTPFQAKRAESTDTLIENSIDILKENGIVKTGDIAVVTAGVVDYAKRHEPAASTNIMRVVNID